MNLLAPSVAELPHQLRSLTQDAPARVPVRPVENRLSQRLFTLRAADSEGHRSSARILVNRMYAWRGYTTSAATLDGEGAADRVTLVATEHDETVGTITIGFDGPEGLRVDELFRDEADALRREHGVLCEFTKLAVDGAVRSKRVLASLFHVAFICAYEIKGCDRILIEVNPRHVRYYQRMLGFDVHSGERLNERVNAPAVLLSLCMRHAREQINRFGGHAELAAAERSLYPYFFSAAEEAGILHRVL